MYFSRECQRDNWAEHKKVCKRIKAGANLVTANSKIPEPVRNGMIGEDFQPFEADDDEDSALEEDDDPADYYDTSVVWEYYDAATADWIGYPTRISRYIERLQESGSPRYMYKPGNKNAEGKEERSLTTNPPSFVSTNHIYYSDMIDRQIYTGAG
eukprot:989393_1